MTRDEIRRILKDALWNFYREDGYLLEIDVHERTIAHKLAEHLQREFPRPEKGRPYSVDCEYNKDCESSFRRQKLEMFTEAELVRLMKLCGERTTHPAQNPLNNQEFMRIFMPDIIVHKRGTGDNLLVIEMKRSKNLSANAERSDCDDLKLKKFTVQENGGLKYIYGAFIKMNTGSDCTGEQLCIIDWYENGERDEDRILISHEQLV